MKKAFLVGINKYGSGNNLNGCINDVLLSYYMLSEKFGFLKKDIEIITDEKATKKNILNGLKWLTTNVSENDTLFFHYSGHGSQVVSKDWTKSNEVDGRDEILCPVDLNWDDPLRDNDLNKIFGPLKNINSVVILDSCHSGTCIRAGLFQSSKKGISDIRPKFITPPITNMLSNPTISIDRNLNYVFPKETMDVQTQLKRFAVSTALQGNAILISGCKENQTSADAFIKNKYHGALTYSLYQILEKFDFKITYAKLIVEVNKVIKRSGFEQVPQLECKEELQNRLYLG